MSILTTRVLREQMPLQATAAILAGVVMLVAPRILNYAVAAYLLVVGTLGLLHFLYGHAIRPQTVIALVAGVLILIKPFESFIKRFPLSISFGCDLPAEPCDSENDGLSSANIPRPHSYACLRM